MAVFAGAAALCAGTAFPAAEGVLGAAVRFGGSERGAMALDIEGRYLYGGAGDRFVVFDLADPLHPKKAGEVAGVGSARQLVVQNGFAYVTSREYGLWIVDATDPTKPRIRSRFDTCELATGVDVAGGVCFCGQRQNGVEFIDVRDPDRPRHIAMLPTDESQSVHYRDGYLYSGEWATGRVTVFDVRDMSAIRRLRTVDLRGFGDGLWSQGGYLYASRGHHGLHRADSEALPASAPSAARLAAEREKNGLDSRFYGMGHGLDVFDLADPACPRRVGTVDFPPLFARGLDMWTSRSSGDLLFAADTHNGLFAVDVADKAHPKVVGRWTAPTKVRAFAEYPGDCVASVAVGDGVVYAATWGGGFCALPCARAKAEARAKGVLPKNAGFRAPYAADENAWYVWRPEDVGQVRAVAFRGDTAYVACGDAGLHVVDVLPEDAGWRGRGKVAGCDRVYDVSVLGDRLFAAEGENGFGVYDVSQAVPREVARLPRISPERHLAFWTVALTEDRLLCSDRCRWALYDISHLPEFRLVKVLPTSCPGWDKYVMDRPVGAGHVAFNHCNREVLWFDIRTGETAARTKRNCTTLANGICAFGTDRALYTRGRGFRLLDPLETDPSDGSLWPVVPLSTEGLPTRAGRPLAPGMPRSDGRYVAFTHRIKRYATLYDFADPNRPVALGGWLFSGNPDAASFHNGGLVVPCGYEGLLLRKARGK